MTEIKSDKYYKDIIIFIKIVNLVKQINSIVIWLSV